MINGDKCALCGIFYPYSQSEIWKHNKGEVNLFRGDMVFANIGKNSELEICQACYESGKLESDLNLQQRREAYYQFGLSFSEIGECEKAKRALEKSLAIKETADCLAALGNIENKLGNLNRAIELYRSALKLESHHFIAGENLKNLLRRN